MSNLALILNTSNEDILEDENNCTVIIDASDVPEVVADIEQKIDDNTEVAETLESLYATHKLIQESLISGNTIAAYSNVAKYEIYAASVSNRLQIDRVSNYSTESLTMNELWNYQVEDGFFSSIKDKIIAFFKWVSEKISAIIKTVKSWFVKGGIDGKGEDNISKIESKIADIKGSDCDTWVMAMSGKMGHTHVGGEFKSVSELKNEYGKLEELFKGYDDFTKEVSKFVLNMDKLKAVKSDVINKQLLDIVESRKNTMKNKQAFCYRFNANIKDGKVQLLYFTYKDATESAVKGKSYSLKCNKNESAEILECHNRINKMVLNYGKNITELQSAFTTLEKNILNEKDTNLAAAEFARVRESVGLIGKVVGSLFSSISIIHSYQPKISKSTENKKEEK